VVQEHHVDLRAQQALLLSAHDALVTRPHDNPHGIAQAGQIDEAGDDGGELRVALEAEVARGRVGLARGRREQDRAVANVPAQLDHDLGRDLGDQRRHDGALLRAHVHEVRVAARVGVDGGQHGRRVVADLRRRLVDEVKEPDLAPVVELQEGQW